MAIFNSYASLQRVIITLILYVEMMISLQIIKGTNKYKCKSVYEAHLTLIEEVSWISL